MKTLELFNAVVSKDTGSTLYVSEDGYVIEPEAVWAKDRIVKFYNGRKLSGEELNKTFHKSWAKVRNSSRYELYLEQIKHYLSTYGSDFKDEVYIPDEVLEIPELKVTFKVIHACSKEEMTEKCLNMLRSGMALKEETINDLLSVLSDELGYSFTGNEGIKNKEAIVKIADQYGVIPRDIMQFLRYIIYRSTGESLLIKNKETIDAIKNSNFNPVTHFNHFGLDKLAEVFNRFKPLFLAYKDHCPKVINRISKLSKVKHKPMVSNPLNTATYKLLTEDDLGWLDNATPFALFKVMSALISRIQGQTDFVYRIRNGKSWTQAELKNTDKSVAFSNFNFICDYLKNKYSLVGKKVYLPKDIEYALPTSEKMYVGNIPTGTKFYGDRLAAGVYWENSWGARDLDLSCIAIGGLKIGWNARYHNDSIIYSGDITNAPRGAVEYMYCGDDLISHYLVINNVFNGIDTAGYKIIVGSGDSIDRDYMMNPNNLLVEVKCESVQKQTIIGMLLPASGGKKQAFVLLNFGAGHARISGRHSEKSIQALAQQWKDPISFTDYVNLVGAELVDNPEDADFDFSLEKLDKDSFTRIFAKDLTLEEVGV